MVWSVAFWAVQALELPIRGTKKHKGAALSERHPLWFGIA